MDFFLTRSLRCLPPSWTSAAILGGNYGGNFPVVKATTCSYRRQCIQHSTILLPRGGVRGRQRARIRVVPVHLGEFFFRAKQDRVPTARCLGHDMLRCFLLLHRTPTPLPTADPHHCRKHLRVHILHTRVGLEEKTFLFSIPSTNRGGAPSRTVDWTTGPTPFRRFLTGLTPLRRTTDLTPSWRFLTELTPSLRIFDRAYSILTNFHRAHSILKIFHRSYSILKIFHRAHSILTIFHRAHSILTNFHRAHSILKIFHRSYSILKIFHRAHSILTIFHRAHSILTIFHRAHSILRIFHRAYSILTIFDRENSPRKNSFQFLLLSFIRFIVFKEDAWGGHSAFSSVRDWCSL